ncbi:hypothetical protein BX264_3338 [Streptomyces sp. 2333.5]|uniref:hypothetical protein n=1 Tax=unclassified Streptomyces TaxID=2593676 RepID=UPI00089BDAF7|nr:MULTISPECIES: hypothetical protein [unclassified Streptomyces]PJJ02971.1 hypothetical protein BX264_3338 [Streptomyces sp. 2333.5]SED65328.1 hypothetical protein SAMN05428943_4073 [Streptomyces sp. 2314.4]SEE23949.1 hypothetical protein SAMN05428942_3440 [Streptomyces sp. 2112.2]
MTGGLAVYRLCRYFSAAVLLFYGFAKINGAQFTVLDSELDKPMGKVSGFWLTWHHFGFSPVFGTVIAVGQIVLALLLCWRRTTLLASCIGLGMMTVILLIDVTHGVDFQGTAMASLTAASLGFIVAQHRLRLHDGLPIWRPIGTTSLRGRPLNQDTENLGALAPQERTNICRHI